MLPPIDPASMARGGRESPRERIVRSFAAWVADGRLAPGTRLPPVRDAAVHFHVDKGTMVRAYHLLAERGIAVSTGRNTRSALVIPGQPGSQALHRTLAVATGIRSADLTSRPDPGRALALANGVLAAAHEGGWSVLFQHGDAPTATTTLPSAMIVAGLVDGADGLIARLVAARVSVAVYGDLLDRDDVDRVVSDHAAGARLLVERLVAQGRRRIVLQLQGQALPWQRARLAGYRAGMRAARLAARPPLDLALPGGWGAEDSELPGRLRGIAGALAEHLTGPEPPDAILAASDGDALQIGGAMRFFHRRVHEDIAICGYDSYWATSPDFLRNRLPAPLLTVDKGNEAIGRALVALAAARLAGSLPASPQTVTVVPTLVEV